MRTDSSQGLLTSSLVAILAFLAIYRMQPPAPVASDAPATQFSAARAMEQLKQIAQKPHPTGSSENARVRQYLAGRLKELGLDAEIQAATAVRQYPKRPGPTVAATVNNVFARLKGTDNTKAVMLVAHYDSVPTAPGASDDGAGTVTLLETLRALKAGPSMKNDVIFLLTDGEELGLLGAQAFADGHPWAKDAGVVLNFEARGACGPSTMFETTPHNGWLLRQFAKAAPHPVASSVTYELYKRLPNDTDLSVFKQAGLAGLNFAYTGCWPRYHTAGDSVRNIDERSLQHHGDSALALTRHFGNLSLPATPEPDSVYFGLLGFIVLYPQRWVLPIALAAVLLLIGTVGLGVKTRRLSRRGILFGLFAWPFTAAIAAVVPRLFWWALVSNHAVNLLPYGMAYGSERCAAGFLFISLAITLGLYAGFRKRASVETLGMGALIWWAVFTTLTALHLQGGSYLFAWPTLFSLIAVAFSFFREAPRSAVAKFLLLALAAAATVLLNVPILYLLMITVSTRGLLAVSAMATLLVGILTPQLELINRLNKWWLSAAAACLGIALLVQGVFESRFDSKQPRADSIFYALDADRGEAFWASADESPDSWTFQFFHGQNKKGNFNEILPLNRPIFESVAPAVELAPPNVAALDDVTLGNDRLLNLWISSRRQARTAWITVRAARIIEARVSGKVAFKSGPGGRVEPWTLVYTGLPREGIGLTLDAEGSDAIEVRITEISDGLPEIPGTSWKPRPASLMPSPSLDIDSSTVVAKTFRFAVNTPMKHAGPSQP